MVISVGIAIRISGGIAESNDGLFSRNFKKNSNRTHKRISNTDSAIIGNFHEIIIHEGVVLINKS